ncbi:single-stranded DNA binding protein [Delftia phage PhiW-14]|uniref:Single-stranded DNA-binding protein n=1 Tax=Delftia phage PhiW-14 TaxID=665032 RepID=C9DFZ1_BPW14|nr:single-stranded DNA binding protein [Delftia phage PhiW-14]ACV50042.1 single-stranded DNA binding protein [Delftia phage PhiW-14]
MVDFSTLRAARGTQGDALKRAMSKTEGGGFKEDPRIWKYTRDEKSNISSSVIRFLSIPKVDYQSVADGKVKEEDLSPMIKLLRLRFEGKNGWFVGYTRATFGENCPVREWTGPKWGALKGKDKEEPTVKAQREYLKRFIPDTEYYAGILVISDMQVPENNGKVFLFKFGEAVRKFLDLAENPKFPNQPKFDPFDPWTGANLHLDLSFEERAFGQRKAFVPKWEQVRWAAPAPMGDDEFIAGIWEQQHSLQEFLQADKFLTYEASKEKLMKVMQLDENLNDIVGGSSAVGRSVGDYGSAPAPQAQSAPAQQAPAHLGQMQAQAQAAPAPAAAPAAQAQPVGEEDPVLARLRQLQNGG